MIKDILLVTSNLRNYSYNSVVVIFFFKVYHGDIYIIFIYFFFLISIVCVNFIDFNLNTFLYNKKFII
jgi:hypothetical protein